MSIITKGMGDSNTLITKGYGSTLVVVVAPSPVYGGGGGTYTPPLEPGVIQTRTIKLPHYKRKISVDVVLIYYDGNDKNINVEASIEEYREKYDNIKVYLEKDVKFYD